MDFLNRDFIENYIRNHKKKIIKVAIGILIFIAAFLVFCIRDGANVETISISPKEEKATTETVLNNDDKGDVEKKTVENEVKNKEEAYIYVDIQGAVQTPYVYKLKEGTRVYEAIDKAGGFLPEAEYSDLNLAEILMDQDKIYVYSSNEKQQAENKSTIIRGERTSGNGKTNNQLININKATAEELQQINGIGPSTAEKIINYRNENGAFGRIEDIMQVSGIGEKTFSKFKEKITV